MSEQAAAIRSPNKGGDGGGKRSFGPAPAAGKDGKVVKIGWRGRLDGLGTAGRDPLLLHVVLTAPVFVIYHVGVIFLTVRNAFDPITGLLLELLHRSLIAYLGLTVGVAAALFAIVRFTDLKSKVRPLLFAMRIGEGTLYAIAMCVVAKAVVAHTLSMHAVGLSTGLSTALSATKGDMSPGEALVMSMGAGFYEELAFRVIAFGTVVWLLGLRKASPRAGLSAGAARPSRWPLQILWAVVVSAAFSAAHYFGSEPFAIGSFVFRMVCGLFLTAVFRFRGFATAVWTHALYDVGVMVF